MNFSALRAIAVLAPLAISINPGHTQDKTPQPVRKQCHAVYSAGSPDQWWHITTLEWGIIGCGSDACEGGGEGGAEGTGGSAGEG